MQGNGDSPYYVLNLVNTYKHMTNSPYYVNLVNKYKHMTMDKSNVSFDNDQMSGGVGYLFLYTVSVFQSLVSEKADIVDIDPDWTGPQNEK